MGNVFRMTLKEYIRTGQTDTGKLAARLGVSEHAVHKWVYGQRAPSLETALEIVRITGGSVDLPSLVKVKTA